MDGRRYRRGVMHAHGHEIEIRTRRMEGERRKHPALMQTTTKRIGSCILKAQKRSWKSAEVVWSAFHRILFIRTSQIRRDWPTPIESWITRSGRARWASKCKMEHPAGSPMAPSRRARISQDTPGASDVPSLQIRTLPYLTLLYRVSA